MQEILYQSHKQEEYRNRKAANRKSTEERKAAFGGIKYRNYVRYCFNNPIRKSRKNRSNLLYNSRNKLIPPFLYFQGFQRS